MDNMDSMDTMDMNVMVSRWRIDQNKPPIPSSRDRTLCSHSDIVAMNKTKNKNIGIALPRGLTINNVFRDRLFSLFLANDFPPGDSLRFIFGERNDWILHVINLPTLTPALEDALLAVCSARLGRHALRPGLVHESLNLYARGLSEVRRDILDTSMRKNDQSLAACLALLLYEIAECPGGTSNGYAAHYQGTMELLLIRGAGAHTSGLAHSVFRILRMHTVS